MPHRSRSQTQPAPAAQPSPTFSEGPERENVGHFSPVRLPFDPARMSPRPTMTPATQNRIAPFTRQRKASSRPLALRTRTTCSPGKTLATNGSGLLARCSSTVLVGGRAALWFDSPRKTRVLFTTAAGSSRQRFDASTLDIRPAARCNTSVAAPARRPNRIGSNRWRQSSAANRGPID